MATTRSLRVLSACALIALLLGLLGPAATAQSPDDLPDPPAGQAGPVLGPLEDILVNLTGPLGDGLGDIPFDNAVRLLGDDAVAAAVALSRITFDTATTAVLGRDDVFADTLSSVAGQGIAGAPLLLTQTDAVDQRTQDELDRLGVSEVVILGAELAISADVEQQLVDAYGADNVTRAGGPSRVETAAELAALLAPTATEVVLLRAYPSEGSDQAQAYADALSAGPFASDAGIPSLLTPTAALHPATAAYLEAAGVTTATLVGGEAAIAPAVEEALVGMGVTVTRIAGENRWETAIRIANAMGLADASEANRIILTEGGGIERPLWAAGFAAAAHGAVFDSPVLLADGPLLPPETIAFLADGLVANALRLNNEPLICNSFVDILACETAALLMAGLLDEVNALTGGQIEEQLGPVVFGPLAEAVGGVVPGPGEDMSPGLVGSLLAVIGNPGTEEETTADTCSDGIDNDGDGTIDNDEECDGSASTALAIAMVDQPEVVRDAVEALFGPRDARVSTSVQGLLLGGLTALEAVGPVDTADEAAATALAAVLDAMGAMLAVGDAEEAQAAAAALDEALRLLDGDVSDEVVEDVLGTLDILAALG